MVQTKRRRTTDGRRIRRGQLLPRQPGNASSHGLAHGGSPRDREVHGAIGLGSDHHGFALKQHLLSFLRARGETVRDFGSFSDEPVDYPPIAAAVAAATQRGSIERGVLVCRTGLGMAIAANKVPGIFAAPVSCLYTARKARESNNAQIIALGADLITPPLACAIVAAWLAADFLGGESARKVSMIRDLEMRCSRSAVGLMPVGVPSC
jgi:ribose 5-phosphate isomerase B